VNKLLATFLNTEYLPMNDVRRLKIIIIFVFLSLFTVITIPISDALNYQIWVKIIFISTFFLGLLLTFLGLKFGKLFFSIQVTIIQAVLFMIYYTQGITSFYAYLLFYIVLTIIAFYQEVYSYFIYGTFVMVLGVFYVLTKGEGLLLTDDLEGALYVYIAGLALYYLTHFIFILINEKSYTEMNVTWINYKRINDGIQVDIFNYLEALRRANGAPPITEEVEFQAAVREISEFIAKQVLKDGSEITNVVDLYFYMHEVGLKDILDNDDLSVNMKKATDSLKKYMFDETSDLVSMLLSVSLKDFPSQMASGDLDIQRLSDKKDEQMIAFAMVYCYIARGLYQRSEWALMNDDALKKLEDFDFEMFFDDDILAFYQDNQELIKKYLSK